MKEDHRKSSRGQAAMQGAFFDRLYRSAFVAPPLITTLCRTFFPKAVLFDKVICDKDCAAKLCSALK
jgi:hypothetical protein